MATDANGLSPKESSEDEATAADDAQQQQEHHEEEEDAATCPNSKRSLKKLLRQQRYEDYRERRRQQRKVTRKRQQEQRQEMRDSGLEPPLKKAPRVRMADSTCRQRVVVDCDYDELMTVKDVAKLNNQLSNCYGANRRAANPLQFHVTAVGGKLLERLEATANGEYKAWDVHIHHEDLATTFPAAANEIVYLTAESDVTLGDLDTARIYVIGGLVDHNHHKGFCHQRALERGWTTARLPIGEHVMLGQRAVLSVVHVYEALLAWTETRDWTRSLQQAIPARKMIAVKQDGQTDDGEEVKVETVAS